MEHIIKAKWKNWNKNSTEDIILRETDEGVYVTSTIVNIGEKKFTVKYEIVCDGAWCVKKFKIELVDTKKILELTANGLGTWSDTSGVIKNLEGAIDIDISASPFTNTLPLRRLKLKENQSEEIVVVYISIPELTISTDRQRYTCIIPHKRYRFESIDSDFMREIECDEHDLVLVYPELFKRVL